MPWLIKCHNQLVKESLLDASAWLPRNSSSRPWFLVHWCQSIYHAWRWLAHQTTPFGTQSDMQLLTARSEEMRSKNVAGVKVRGFCASTALQCIFLQPENFTFLMGKEIDGKPSLTWENIMIFPWMWSLIYSHSVRNWCPCYVSCIAVPL